MSQKNVDDYLMEGLYGVRLPKEAERNRFLGSLRERIAIALTIGQVMSDSGLKELEEAMKQHPNTKLILNGQIAYRFLTEEKDLAKKHNISWTSFSNEECETDIGAVLVYDYAVNIEDIFIKEPEEDTNETVEPTNQGLWDKLRSWF